MKTLYLDIFSGISGDMFIGAMLDLGVDFETLRVGLSKLGVEEYHLHLRRAQKMNIEGIKFDVHLAHEHDHHHAEPGHAHSHGADAGSGEQEHEHVHEHVHTHEDGVTHTHPHTHVHSHAHSHSKAPGADEPHVHDDSRDFAGIKTLIESSGLSPWVKQKAVAVFHRVAVAEGKIHGRPPDKVHFHEVGAVDSIVDIVGACLCLELLGRPRVLAASPVEGQGWVDCAHGRFPIPTTATLEILGARGIALTQCDEPHELITPTGAALLAEFVEEFGPMRALRAQRIGYGLGTRDNQTRPNVLRAVLSDSGVQDEWDWETDVISVLETNLDDINAELLGHFTERALAEGALDVFHTPIQMKKNRPGVLLTVLCAASEADRFAGLILRETSAFGVRFISTERRKLRREIVSVKTAFGEVKVKVGRLNGKAVQAAPEFESCRNVADNAGVALKAVYDAATKALNL